MNQATYIIDGYNAMRSILTQKERAGSLERARTLLESRLAAFRRARAGARICLVYDGARGIVGPARQEPGFEVRFSRPPRTADDVVIDLCRSLEGSPGIHVVTSDFKDIASRVASLRLRHLTSAEFGAMVRRRLEKAAGGGDSARGEGKPRAMPRAEVDDWVRKFGFEDRGEESP